MVSPTSSSFYVDGEQVDEGVVVSNDHAPATSTVPSSFYADGGTVGEGTVVPNETAPGLSSTTPGSFFTDGGLVGAEDVTNNDNVPDNRPRPAPTSFYPEGNLYDFLSEESAVLAELNDLADQVRADKLTADADAANASASSAAAATSAANAANAVQAKAGTATPLMDGTAAVGTSDKWAHEDHVHPQDAALVAYVDTKVAGIVNSAPSTLDTLNELATALGDDPNFATTTATQIGLKADKTYVDAQDAAINAKFFPSGTVMLFHQTTAPTGWTKRTDHNDKLLRVVSGTVTTGGGVPFSTFNAMTTVGTHVLGSGEVPNLNVSVSGTVTVYPAGTSGYYAPISPGGWSTVLSNNFGSFAVAYAGSGTTYTNSFSGGNSMSGATTNGAGGGHNHPITMNVQYLDMIIAQKD
jgi:hypothetical protein